jgi:general secretion pathway protein D
MTRLRRLGLLAAAALLAVSAAGCAAHWAYRQGQDAGEKADWDLAVARFTRALEKDPKNIGYKIALENARLQASRSHYEEAKKHVAANDFVKAADELDIASKFDPANRSISDDLEIVRKRLRKQEEEQRERAEFDQMKARAQAAARVPTPVLSPRSPVPITLTFREGSLQKVFESLGRIVGVNILFDEGFRDKKTDVVLTGVTFEEALDRLTFVNRLFYKVVDQNTIIIVPESRQKRVAYDDLLLRTFYVQNAEINDTVNLIKTLAKITTAAGNPSLGAITVLGTVDQLAMAEKIIDANDKARGEVVIEVQFLEVNRTAAKQWGINLSNYTLGATLSPTGSSDEIRAGVLSMRAHLLSSLNQADWIISLPSTVLARFIASDSVARILAAPRLRAAEGKKAEMKIGQEVPIPVTSYSVGLSGGTNQGYLPATSFQYKTVGVNLSLTPRVSASGDITLEMAAEFSILGPKSNVGSEQNPINVPTFSTRNVTGVLRLRDGETGLIGGLLQSAETKSFAGALGMNSIPVLGKLFGARDTDTQNSEVIISITPHIVRAPKVTEDDLVALRVGTQEVPRVEGARPSLFGTEPEPPAGASAPGAPVPPSAGAAAGPSAGGRPAAPPPGAPAAAAPTQATPAPSVVPAAPSAPSPVAPGSVVPAAPPPGASAEAPPMPPETGAATPAAAPAADARPVTALVSPPEVALRVGQAGSLAVVLVGAKDVQSVEISLAWDPALAEVTDVAAGSLLTLDGSPISAERAIENGRARVRFARATGATGSGAVVAVTMKGLKAGTGSVQVESLALGHGGTSERPAPPAPGRLVVAP